MATSNQKRSAAWSQAGRTLLAALLAVSALPAGASATLLELYLGPHDTDQLELRSVRVELDGALLPVPLPGAKADTEQPIYSVAIRPGAHQLKVELGLVGASGWSFFSYLEEVQVVMRGQLALDGQTAEVLAVQAQVSSDKACFTPWSERHHFRLRAAHYPSDRAAAANVAEAVVAAPEPAASPAPALEPVGTPAAPHAAATGAASPATAPSAGGTPPAPGSDRADRPRAAAAGACALGPVHFGFDKSELTASARAALEPFASCLAGTTQDVRLEGHADPQGPDDYNLRLSERRAKAVAAFLKERGVAARRITIRALGETQLVCRGVGPACNSQNRRVEAIVAD